MKRPVFVNNREETVHLIRNISKMRRSTSHPSYGKETLALRQESDMFRSGTNTLFCNFLGMQRIAIGEADPLFTQLVVRCSGKLM